MTDEQRWSSLDAYFASHVLRDDPALDAALHANRDAGLPPIDVSPLQGKFLHLLATLVGARRVLEIGTLGGYSTIWLARAVGETGRVITLERDPHHAAIAAANIAAASLADRVDIRTGAALELLPTLDPPFDLAFIDADKANTPHYFDHALRLVRRGGLILLDNVVRDGAVADPADTRPDVVGMRALFDRLVATEVVDATVLQTVGLKGWDGLAIARVV